MIKIGITGGIGSGKSYVSKMLGRYGIPVFDCDSEAKTLTVQDEAIRSGLTELLGPTVYTADGLNKPVLAAYLFASKDNATRINSIIHPRVKACFREWAARQSDEGHPIVAMESAILIESGFHTEVDQIVMVHAPLEVRCQRVIARDHTTLEEVKKRIAAQLSDEVKCQQADFIIENDGIAALDDQLDKLISRLNGIKGDK